MDSAAHILSSELSDAVISILNRLGFQSRGSTQTLSNLWGWSNSAGHIDIPMLKACVREELDERACKSRL